MNSPFYNQQRISPLFLHQYNRYLPTAFNEELSLLQKVNLIIREMEKVGQTVNEVVDHWNTVMEWLLEEGVSKEVVNQLNNWLEDGTLASIINETLFAKKPDIFIQKDEPVNADSNTIWFQEIEVF